VEKVVIMEDAVEIDLSRSGLAERLGIAGILPPQPNADGISLRAEARLKRLGGETKLIIRTGPPSRRIRAWSRHWFKPTPGGGSSNRIHQFA
jgi:hypothetical protein